MDKNAKVSNITFTNDAVAGGNQEARRKADKTQRLVQWMTDLLLGRLRHIVARRKVMKGNGLSAADGVIFEPNNCPLQEVVEAIKLPEFDHNTATMDPDEVEIPPDVAAQLQEHVAAIAAKYNDNFFHNFEHACHVTMAVSKLLGRVVTPDIGFDNLTGQDARKQVMSRIHGKGFGGRLEC